MDEVASSQVSGTNSATDINGVKINRDHSYIDVLEHVSDGVHVALVGRKLEQPQPAGTEQWQPAAEDAPASMPRAPESRKGRPAKR